MILLFRSRYALGGSTNAVLHLLALAHEAEVDIVIDDFNRIGEKVPLVGERIQSPVPRCPDPLTSQTVDIVDRGLLLQAT